MSKVITLRVTDAEHAAVHGLAKANRRSMKDQILQLVEDHVKASAPLIKEPPKRKLPLNWQNRNFFPEEIDFIKDYCAKHLDREKMEGMYPEMNDWIRQHGAPETAQQLAEFDEVMYTCYPSKRPGASAPASKPLVADPDLDAIDWDGPDEE